MGHCRGRSDSAASRAGGLTPRKGSGWQAWSHPTPESPACPTASGMPARRAVPRVLCLPRDLIPNWGPCGTQDLCPAWVPISSRGVQTAIPLRAASALQVPRDTARVRPDGDAQGAGNAGGAPGAGGADRAVPLRRWWRARCRRPWPPRGSAGMLEKRLPMAASEPGRAGRHRARTLSPGAVAARAEGSAGCEGAEKIGRAHV